MVVFYQNSYRSFQAPRRQPSSPNAAIVGAGSASAAAAASQYGNVFYSPAKTYQQQVPFFYPPGNVTSVDALHAPYEPVAQYRELYEAARSFDPMDDEIFCPGLVSDDEDDLISLSTASDAPSVSSNSPGQSPVSKSAYSAADKQPNRTPSPSAPAFEPSPPPFNAVRRARRPIPIVSPRSSEKRA